MATVTMLLIGGLLLVPAGSREQCPTSYVVQPRLDGVTGPWGLFLTSIPRSLPCLTCARLPGLEDEQRQKIAVLLSLRGGGARNKWRRKQNRNRVAGKDSGAARPGVAAAQEAHGPSFQAHWQNFKRGAGRWQGFQPGSRDRGTRRQARADVSEEASFISSREVDSDGNEVVYVDSQGNEVPARYILCALFLLALCSLLRVKYDGRSQRHRTQRSCLVRNFAYEMLLNCVVCDVLLNMRYIPAKLMTGTLA